MRTNESSTPRHQNPARFEVTHLFNVIPISLTRRSPFGPPGPACDATRSNRMGGTSLGCQGLGLLAVLWQSSPSSPVLNQRFTPLPDNRQASDAQSRAGIQLAPQLGILRPGIERRYF